MKRGGATGAVDHWNIAEAVSSTRRNVRQGRKGVFVLRRLVVVIGCRCRILQSAELAIDVSA